MSDSMLDHYFIRVECPKCGHVDKEVVIRYVMDKDNYPCFKCRHQIDLEPYSSEIKEKVDTAIELDKKK